MIVTRFRVLALLLIPAAVPASAGSLNRGSADPLQLSGSSITLQIPVPDDSLRSNPDNSTLRMKEMIDRETGEGLIEGNQWQRKKNPRVAMLCALAVPGLGQIYNEKPLKAFIAAGFEIFYLSRILHYYRLERREAALRDSTPQWITTAGDDPVTYQNPVWRTHDLWVKEYSEKQIDWLWWSAGCVLAIVLDSYIDAYLHDMNFRIEGSTVEESAGVSLVIDF